MLVKNSNFLTKKLILKHNFEFKIDINTSFLYKVYYIVNNCCYILNFLNNLIIKTVLVLPDIY